LGEQLPVLLALSVIGTDAARLGLNGYKVFDERGGVIGRLDNSDWILRDPVHLVSGCHARITHRNQVYFVEDTSSNGTFINDPGRPVQRDAAMPLHDGDRLFIGSFEILVQLIDDLPVMVADLSQGAFDSLPPLSVEPNELGHRSDQSKPVSKSNSGKPTAPPMRRTQGPLTGPRAAENTGVDSPRIAEHAATVLRACLQEVLATLKTQSEMRRACGLVLSPDDMSDLSALRRCAGVQSSEQALLQELGTGRSALIKAVTGAFQEIGLHDTAMFEAQQAATRALIAQCQPQRGDQSGTGSGERDRSKLLQTAFDAVFQETYAAHVEMLRARGASPRN
jgi:predicted component of type VI protein secretion system